MHNISTLQNIEHSKFINKQKTPTIEEIDFYLAQSSTTFENISKFNNKFQFYLHLKRNIPVFIISSLTIMIISTLIIFRPEYSTYTTIESIKLVLEQLLFTLFAPSLVLTYCIFKKNSMKKMISHLNYQFNNLFSHKRLAVISSKISKTYKTENKDSYRLQLFNLLENSETKNITIENIDFFLSQYKQFQKLKIEYDEKKHNISDIKLNIHNN